MFDDRISKDARRGNPDRGRNHFMRSDALQERGAAGDREKALADLDEFVRLNPRHGAGFVRRAVFREFLGHIEQAMADFDEAIKVEPTLSDGHCGRGALCSRSGKVDQALADLSQALLLQPTDPAARISRGDVWKQKGEIEKAISDYNDVIRTWPLLSSGYAHRGVAGTGRTGQGVSRFQ